MTIKSEDEVPMSMAGIAMVLGGLQYLAGRKRKHNAGQNARIPDPLSCAL